MHIYIYIFLFKDSSLNAAPRSIQLILLLSAHKLLTVNCTLPDTCSLRPGEFSSPLPERRRKRVSVSSVPSRRSVYAQSRGAPSLFLRLCVLCLSHWSSPLTHRFTDTHTRTKTHKRRRGRAAAHPGRGHATAPRPTCGGLEALKRWSELCWCFGTLAPCSPRNPQMDNSCTSSRTQPGQVVS